MAYSEVTKRQKVIFDSKHLSVIKSHRAPGIADFDIIKPISRGAFGQVYLARRKNSKKFFALKSMKKKDVLNKNMMDQVVAERDALAISSKSPYVVQLYYSFQSDEKIFLVMEYMIGGDVKSLLHNLGYFDVHMAKIYIAETTLALEYLHSHSIYHRDIKPDNMLLSQQGHIKLTDFGLSCLSSDRKPNIIDLMNTPVVLDTHAKKQKKIFWRTPGQLQSLTSKFTFSLPCAKEEVASKNLHSMSSLAEFNEYIFSSPQQCVGNRPLNTAAFLTTPNVCRNSSTPCQQDGVNSGQQCSGITSDLCSISLRKRSFTDMNDENMENGKPLKRVRIFSHSLPYELEASTCCKNEQKVRFNDDVQRHEEDGEIDHPSSVYNNSNISGVTALTETSQMSVSCLSELDIVSPKNRLQVHKPRVHIKCTPSPDQMKTVPCSLTPSNDRPNSLTSHTPIKELQFSDSKSPNISIEFLSSPTKKVKRLSISKTPELVNVHSTQVNITSPKHTPFRTPKSCIRGRPREKKRILGTPDYLAPEILLGKDHEAPVDWWALGVCFYEFLTGIPPFNDDTPELVFQHILDHDMIWPEGDEELPVNCVTAIQLMLTEDPKDRPKAGDIKSMSCFEDINWSDLHKEEAPFVPQPDDVYDTTYFTARNLANHLQMSNFKP